MFNETPPDSEESIIEPLAGLFEDFEFVAPSDLPPVQSLQIMDTLFSNPVEAAPEPVSRAASERNEAQWESHLHYALVTSRKAAKSLPGAPDAAELVQALSTPSEFVIRQLPASAREALELCDDPNMSRSRLAERLGQNPPLVQAMLRVANSASANTGGRPVLKLTQALERLGTSAARSILFANCVDGLLSRPGQPYEAMVLDIWTHMIRAGQTSRVTARCFNVDADEAFSVALLHDVGKLIVFDQISALRTKLRRPVSIPVLFLHQLLQDTHEAIGAMAAFTWGMGSHAANAIGTHHRSDAAAGPYALAETLYLAERIDHASRLRSKIDFEKLWKAGKLSGSPAKAAELVNQHLLAA